MAQQRGPLQIRLLSVPDCPLATKVRKSLDECLGRAHVNAVVEEAVGDYSSPTLLVDGFDVTGRLARPDEQISCRLDLPSNEQILVALYVLSVLKYEDGCEKEVAATAFRTLLHSGERVCVTALEKTLTDLNGGVVKGCVEKLHRSGHLELDSDGFIVGAVGLSLTPSKHEIEIDGKRFWTWCALDVIGIFGALGASGSAKSYEPSKKEAIQFNFVNGVLQDTDVLVSIPDPKSVGSVCCDWCPNVNFFACRSAAEEWIQETGVRGALVSASNLANVAREAWSRCINIEIA